MWCQWLNFNFLHAKQVLLNCLLGLISSYLHIKEVHIHISLLERFRFSCFLVIGILSGKQSCLLPNHLSNRGMSSMCTANTLPAVKISQGSPTHTKVNFKRKGCTRTSNFFWYFSHSNWHCARFLAVSSCISWMRSFSKDFNLLWWRNSDTLLSVLSWSSLNLKEMEWLWDVKETLINIKT